MAKKKSTQPAELVAVESAIAEIRRQLEQGYALISAARSRMVEFTNHDDTVPDALLDMAEDVLGDLRWVNRIGSFHERMKGGEAAHG